ncbi:MAG: hypothetical protein PHR64_00300 [Candidatus Shapirobacteria bacterium]|nr:hypothetical protein [Candidatus Shapirobacteria bacterium]MDD5073659.1 hypothetical protein [Candidatus Shapirobacteria bacterium]MDD5481380.1 hypothetical protein [Candidatus Shapirobacteria bacterium]
MKPFIPTALSLEEAVLAALAYSDLFAHPLTVKEVWFWLPKEAPLKEVGQSLARLVKRRKIYYSSPFYFLSDRAVIDLRQKKQAFSRKKMFRAEKLGQKLACLPWVGLVAISGNLAISAAEENDDIDFFIIALPGCLYRARLASVLLAEIFGQRRRPGEKEAANKICLNLFLEKDNLSLPRTRQDFYTAHEALQLLPIAGDHDLYQQFLLSNSWLANYLPQAYRKRLEKGSLVVSPILKNEVDFLERMAMFGQSIYAKAHQRQLVADNKRQLFFHPQDQRQPVLVRFQKTYQKLIMS